MTKLALAVAVLAVAAHAYAATPEAARSGSAEAFAVLAQSRLVEPPKISRVRLNGTVTLTGHGHVQKVQQNTVSVTLTGRASFTDSSGKISTGQVDVTYTGTMRVSSDRIDDRARPRVSVSVYRDGKYVGTAQLSGDFVVTGRISNGWYEVTGSGNLTGDADVRE